MLRRQFPTALAASALVISGTSQADAQNNAAFQRLKKQFDYDRTVPLRERYEAESTAAGISIKSLSYDGFRGPVSASIVSPTAAGKYPAIVFLHDFCTSRHQFLAEAARLARASRPAVSLLLDAPAARPVGWRRTFNPTLENNDRDIHIQAVIDIRRGVDLLASRVTTVSKQFAYVGHGYGANWGAILSSIEPRFQAFALIAGMASMSDAMRSDDPEWADMRHALGNERFKSYLDSLAAVDPIHYLPHSLGSPVLLQFGTFDPIVSRSMAERLIDATPDPRTVRRYLAGHEVNDPQALNDRSEFLADLKL